MKPRSLANRVLIGLALVHVAGSVLGTVLWTVTGNLPSWQSAFLGWVQFVDVVALTAGAGLLLTGNAGDPRARHLGTFFLLLATSFTPWGVNRLSDFFSEGLLPPVTLLWSLKVETFMPLFLWLFVRSFPRPALGQEDDRISVGIGVAAGIGSLLFAVNLAAGFWQLEGIPVPALLEPLVYDHAAYYPTLMLLMLTALAWLVSRVRRAPRRERRRARLFVAAFVLAVVPIFAMSLLLTLFPPLMGALVESTAVYIVVFCALHLLFLSLPSTTAYAVLKHRVLDVRLIARRAVQHLLARGTVTALALAPLLGVGLYLYAHRSESLGELLSGGRLLLMVLAAGVGLAAFSFRQPLLDAVDRRFFRERYDARRLLTELSARIRDARDPLDMAYLVVSGVDRALHLTTATLLVEDVARGQLVDPQNRAGALDVSSPLPLLAAATRAPLEVDLTNRHGAARRLPREVRHYLVDAGFQLVVPLAASDGHLVGLLALGEKRSGLPFLKEDLSLLQAVADAAALGLELFQVRAQHGEAPPTPWATEPAARVHARECLQCGRIQPPAAERCPDCRRILTLSTVPFLLPGRFRFEERVGAGGMGVVYRATDLALGRPVAIKTLRTVSPEHALRLRREARTTASVSHPNLAFVYGLETWHGTPMLVLEFLEGGTLSQRLREGSPLEPVEVAELGLAMARGLAHLHREDVLHRDVKPSNIGYGRDGTPKLMDFGIARLATDHRLERSGAPVSGADASLPPTSIWNDPSTLTTEHQIVGTLSYVPPEVLEGDDPSPAGDLWGLALVLYEALTGKKAYPPRDGSIELMERILREPVADVRTLRPDTPDALVKVLAKALARNPEERYADALEMEDDLKAATRDLSGIRQGVRVA
jgi:GAF domain-containing protein